MSTALPPTAPPDRHDAVTWGADPYADALRSGRGPLFLRRSDGWLLPLEVERWCAGADTADLSALRRCEGAVLDIGCGPGRLVAALAAQGRRALGIDVSAAAVARTAATGGSALHRSVFDSLPHEGGWDTALLLDGNIGIGGDPCALLARSAELVSRQGLLIVETTPEDVDERVQVRVERGYHPRTGTQRAPGAPFPWARVGAPALLRHAATAGWTPVEQWTVTDQTDRIPGAERCFVSLRGRARPTC
ncbi:methyltransferase domain-containing protein [Streptomyces decoyicus]|uniref:methyltransferase domain-containing protein n=1 Tax=Streptomyces decoyicus TaxID=249567 RepID=UPI000662BA6F|nr:methyltransferase domain-containing protein [Streptomyces decoyicus]KOG48771.1 methyltransferase type 11 [Streptomyces decoyicus]QZY18775.1 class I SAM-dependent methyltransferase [Streptomyces decoyicus]